MRITSPRLERCLRADERRLDLLAATGHDINTGADFRQLQEYGIRTVRDGLRWHLIETSDGRYDWSSFLPMLRAAQETGTETIWDLMHYGWPDNLDIWSPRFVERFGRFAANVARLIKSETDTAPFFCPINEISYLAWAGGDAGYLNPFARGRSFELKAQLARARFVLCEPVIHIAADPTPGQRLEAARAPGAVPGIPGALWPQLGGQPHLLDIVGVNYYPQNQWRLSGPTIDHSDPRYRPFRSLLSEVHARYGRRVLVAETGTEGEERRPWFASIMHEVGLARRAGIPVEGVCLYPIVNHIGWDDDRDCPSGLLGSRADNGKRDPYPPLADMVRNFRERSVS